MTQTVVFLVIESLQHIKGYPLQTQKRSLRHKMYEEEEDGKEEEEGEEEFRYHFDRQHQTSMMKNVNNLPPICKLLLMLGL